MTQAGRRLISATDFTLLVIGAIVGADVYVVSTMAASFLGPAQLLAWIAAGLLAAIIALAFVQCAAIEPEVGGTYAYVRSAFGDFAGFLAGWALYLGEWVALPVFPLAFASYLGYFMPAASPLALRLVAVLMVALVTGVNILGVRSGARLNDVLTLAKLLPLAVLIFVGLLFAGLHPVEAARNLTPFAPLGWSGFGAAVILIFWAYAGFELAVLPAAEVEAPRTTLPRGLIVGMSIATTLYLLVSATTAIALPWQDAAASSRPLADAMAALLDALGWPPGIGASLMSAGALVSIAGVYDVFTLSVARLSYAMAVDGLFPSPFARIHSSYGTPWVGLVFQGACAAGIALLFDVRSLIDVAVFFLGICYVATALAAIRLVGRAPRRALHVGAPRLLFALGALGGAYLSLQAPIPLIGAGAFAMLGAAFAYAVRSAMWRATAARRVRVEREERSLAHAAARREHWLTDTARRVRRRNDSART